MSLRRSDSVTAETAGQLFDRILSGYASSNLQQLEKSVRSGNGTGNEAGNETGLVKVRVEQVGEYSQVEAAIVDAVIPVALGGKGKRVLVVDLEWVLEFEGVYRRARGIILGRGGDETVVLDSVSRVTVSRVDTMDDVVAAGEEFGSLAGEAEVLLFVLKGRFRGKIGVAGSGSGNVVAGIQRGLCGWMKAEGLLAEKLLRTIVF